MKKGEKEKVHLLTDVNGEKLWQNYQRWSYDMITDYGTEENFYIYITSLMLLLLVASMP